MININRYCIALLAFVTSIFVSLSSFGQADRRNIDSIKSFVQKLSSDTEKVNTLLDLTKGIECEDSVKKLALAYEAKRIANKINWANGIRNSNIILALIYFQCKKNDTVAFDFLEANVAFAKKNSDKANEALAYEGIAKEYEILRQHQKAIEYYDMALELKPGVTTEAAIFSNIGLSYKSVGDNQRAINFYDSSYLRLSAKQSRDLQDTFELAGIYLNRGDVYLDISQPDKAMEQFKLVLGSGAADKDKQFYIWGLTGYGKACRMKKDYKNAIESYQKALLTCKQINGFDEEVRIKSELANTYLETWDITKALSYADSSLSLAETQHYINLLSKCNENLGNIYLKQDKYDLAITYLQKALGIAKQTNSVEDQKDDYEVLYNAYKKAGQWQAAIIALENFNVLKDSLYSIDKLNELARGEMTKDFQSRQMIDSVRNQVIFDKRIEKQRVITYSGFTALILVVLLAYFMYRNYKTQRKYNELLSKEKKTHLAHIEAQSNILSDIAHTQAHQVRGPVSTILGLVHIFNYDDPTDPINKQVMEWITSTTEKLDIVIKDVILKENKLREEHEEEEAKNNPPKLNHKA